MNILMALLKEENNTVFQKTLAVSDFYFGSKEHDFPIGLIQMCATSHGEQIRGEAVPRLAQLHSGDPRSRSWPKHSMDFWLQTEDIPLTENRITYQGRQGVSLDVTETNEKPAQDPQEGAREAVLRDRREHAASRTQPLSRQGHSSQRHRAPGRHDEVRARIPGPRCSISTAGQHDVDNLYVADASFFPSIGAVNPTLTIIANALRIGDIVKKRLAA